MVPSRLAESFLDDYDGPVLRWVKHAETSAEIEAERVLPGNGEFAIEVTIASALKSGPPGTPHMRALFKKRHNGRPSPVVLIVVYATPAGDHLAAVAGTSGDPAPVTGLRVDVVVRIC